MDSGAHRFEKWERIRSKGMLRFVVVQGALAWGLATAAIFSLLMWLVSDMDIARVGPLSIVVFPVGGLLWGAAVWWIVEWQYGKHMRVRSAD